MESREYTITAVTNDGVVVELGFDNSVQVLANAPRDDADKLEAFMADYVDAYIAGKSVEAKEVSQDVSQLVGKKLEAKEVSRAEEA